MIEHDDTPFERAIAAGDREFRELAAFAPVMIWRSGPDRFCDWFNKPWLDFAGRPMDEEVGDGWAMRVHPDDAMHCMSTYVDAFHRRQPFSMEYRMRRHDGEYRWLLDNGTPYFRGALFAGYWGSCTDVSVLRREQHAQLVLIHELTHRVKNTLAIVQGIAMQSFREGRPADEALLAFESRLIALGGAHDLLVSQAWGEVALGEVIRATAAPHDPGRGRIAIRGPEVRLCPETATSVAMVVHELLTNATKYGALSGPRGCVTIHWSREGDAPEGAPFRLEWEESGGPVVEAPAQRGFGTRFIERALGSACGAPAVIEFHPDGVRCVLSVHAVSATVSA